MDQQRRGNFAERLGQPRRLERTANRRLMPKTYAGRTFRLVLLRFLAMKQPDQRSLVLSASAKTVGTTWPTTILTIVRLGPLQARLPFTGCSTCIPLENGNRVRSSERLDGLPVRNWSPPSISDFYRADTRQGPASCSLSPFRRQQ